MSKFRIMRNKLSERLELPEEAVINTYRLSLSGDCAILSGAKKLLVYKAEEISVLAKGAEIKFFGEHLKCVYFFEGTIEIRGEIREIGVESK